MLETTLEEVGKEEGDVRRRRSPRKPTGRCPEAWALKVKPSLPGLGWPLLLVPALCPRPHIQGLLLVSVSGPASTDA